MGRNLDQTWRTLPTLVPFYDSAGMTKAPHDRSLREGVR